MPEWLWWKRLGIFLGIGNDTLTYGGTKMSDSSPSVQEWKNLYDAAIKFKEIGSWNWMWDSDIFGVQNPANGEIGYCCIMGRLGEHFALALYLGTDGLEGYLRIRSGKIPMDYFDALHLQKCLMASFEDRQFLQKPDIQIIKKLDLKFRGRNSWPLFRSYRPGYHPWYLTSEEARYLTLALQQAIEVSLRFKKDPDILTPPKENYYLVRVPEMEGECLRWRDEWIEPQPIEKVEIVAELIDDVRIERIKKMVSHRYGVWEADFFHSPTVVREKEERPYYPYVFLLVDHHSYFILNAHLSAPSKYRSEFPEQFLNLIANIKFLPNEILVRKEEVFKLLEPITSELNIKLRLVKRLTALEEAQNNMFEFLTNRKL